MWIKQIINGHTVGLRQTYSLHPSAPSEIQEETDRLTVLTDRGPLTFAERRSGANETVH